MTTLNVFELPKLRKPVLIEGLPGIGNIGKVCVEYMVQELGAKPFAELYSEHFFPFVLIHEKWEIKLLKARFYFYKGKQDLIFLTGDCQSMSSEGHYEIMEKVLDLAEKLKVREIITLGGLATGELEEKPKVFGAATDEKLIKKYGNLGISFRTGEKVGYIVGAAGLLLGLGKERGIDGICLLAETAGFPIITDPKAAEEVLKIVSKMLNLKIDLTKLDKRVKEMERFIHRIEELQQKALSQLAREKQPKREQLGYIG
ncbi:MAG: proteasome assembly chaperone family protein [Candidatus Aenigmatarchaeota archaeon]|nr:MAG: proteasome assembly chaperone family protein [Candidatus Aenigmarchaeota archaeon]